MSLGNFMRTQLFSAFSPVKIGMDVMTKDEGVAVDSLVGHGGIFTTPKVAQKILAAAFDTPIKVMATAAEGGAWGMAVLADYLWHADQPLADYLDTRVFADAASTTEAPDANDVAGFEAFFDRFRKGLPIEPCRHRKHPAGNQITVHRNNSKPDERNTIWQRWLITARKYELKSSRCAKWSPPCTSSSSSGIWWCGPQATSRSACHTADLMIIKPSGLRYEYLTPSSMVVCDLDGNVVDGAEAPSSDTASHAYIYRHMPDVYGVVHTHSTYATAWAATGQNIRAA